MTTSKMHDSKNTKNKSRSVRRGVESDAKSNHTQNPFADFKMVRELVHKLGYTPSPHGVSGVREINLGRDFLRVADF